jgi:hypothetical protein
VASVNQVVRGGSLCRTWYARAQMHQNRFASAVGILASSPRFPTRPLPRRGAISSPARATGPLVSAEELEESYGRRAVVVHHEPSWASGFAAAE